MAARVAAGLDGFGDPPLLLQVCFVVLGPLLFPFFSCLTLGAQGRARRGPDWLPADARFLAR